MCALWESVAYSPTHMLMHIAFESFAQAHSTLTHKPVRIDGGSQDQNSV